MMYNRRRFSDWSIRQHTAPTTISLQYARREKSEMIHHWSSWQRESYFSVWSSSNICTPWFLASITCQYRRQCMESIVEQMLLEVLFSVVRKTSSYRRYWWLDTNKTIDFLCLNIYLVCKVHQHQVNLCRIFHCKRQEKRLGWALSIVSDCAELNLLIR